MSSGSLVCLDQAGRVPSASMALAGRGGRPLGVPGRFAPDLSLALADLWSIRPV
ncbi:hypothetical protein [Microvirga sp. VF16]|uniref:hypothetical protein n=1 Tax=Microvirga sp. VF16 TaxID=2807101 RepID=UPI00193D90FC|nr:hypothetical protein [Microvirga sp. VF16]QRM34950.1 hypothetical protein JO965_42585 [Microvirga sp. VF16]